MPLNKRAKLSLPLLSKTTRFSFQKNTDILHHASITIPVNEWMNKQTFLKWFFYTKPLKCVNC